MSEREKFETLGVEMLSGIQERTILISESLRHGGSGVAWYGNGLNIG
ncbi:hypothetical protein EAG_08630 [Camponotus floridanus]|uniref:Uncharacterized protein n=1 Tax=Camponotus floridanus TaxID=104421 RepID=E2AZM6_CAMFO|nr:hypothetical protein EAG_08630 [Camponotus floridanus]